eukprot:928044-Amphidinium_carterae.1
MPIFGNDNLGSQEYGLTTLDGMPPIPKVWVGAESHHHNLHPASVTPRYVLATREDKSGILTTWVKTPLCVFEPSAERRHI